MKGIGSKLSFRVYRKPTHTGRYLHFPSVHPASHKRSVGTTLLQRAKRICTEQNDLAIDSASVRRDLSACGYPPSFVSAVERQLSRPVLSSAPSGPKRAPVPHVSEISETLSCVMRTYGVQIAHVPTRKLKDALVNVKDNLSKEKFPGVVYSVPCGDCECSYIGETGNFEKRIKHDYDVRKHHVASNALAEHCDTLGHGTHFCKREEPDITTSPGIIIQTTERTLNRTQGNLPPVYSHCLHHILKRT